MQSNLYENNFDQFTKILIRKKAQQLLGKKGFTCSDRNDIEQELTLKLLKAGAPLTRARPIGTSSSPQSSNAAPPISCATSRRKNAITSVSVHSMW